jgi:hypothetical protein
MRLCSAPGTARPDPMTADNQPYVKPLRFAYADPPYIGQAKRLYGKHHDYAGEVDHEALVAQLENYDGWALSVSMKSLHYVLGLCPPDVMVLAWVKPNAPPFGDGRMYAWEPVIMRGGRNPALPTRTALVALIRTLNCGPDHIIGAKPPEFCRWLFACAGLVADDDFTDLFPGSGAVGREWDRWRSQQVLSPWAVDSEGPTVLMSDGSTRRPLWGPGSD